MKKTWLGVVFICITLFISSCGNSASQTETETPVSTTNMFSKEDGRLDEEKTTEEIPADNRQDQEQVAIDFDDSRTQGEELEEDFSDLGAGREGTPGVSFGSNSSIYELLSEKAEELKTVYGSLSEEDFSYQDVNLDDLMNGKVSLEDRSFGEGLLLTDIYDYDHDRVPELLVIRRDTGTMDEDKGYGIVERKRSEYTLEMYEIVQDECRLADSIMVGVFDILNWSVASTEMSVYRHETDTYTNICIGTNIGQQDNFSGRALIEIRYEEEAFSLADGIRYGWNACLEPASEQAIEYLSIFGISPDYCWDTIYPSEYTDTDHFTEVNRAQVVNATKKKLKEMGFIFTHSSDEAAQFDSESESEPDSQDETFEDNQDELYDSYTPIDGTLSLIAFLYSEADYIEYGEMDQVRLNHHIDVYTGSEDIESDNANTGDENTAETYDDNSLDIGDDNTADTAEHNTMDNTQKDLLEPYLGDGWCSNSMTSDENGYPAPAFTAEIYDGYIEIKNFEGPVSRKQIAAVERDEDGVLIKLDNGEAYFGPDEDPNALWFYFEWERREDNMSGSDSLFRSE